MRGLLAWCFAIILAVVHAPSASELDWEEVIIPNLETSMPKIEDIMLYFDEMCPLHFCESDDGVQTAVFDASKMFPYQARAEYLDYKLIGVELYRNGQLVSAHRLQNDVWSSYMVNGRVPVSMNGSPQPLELFCTPNS